MKAERPGSSGEAAESEWPFNEGRAGRSQTVLLIRIDKVAGTRQGWHNLTACPWSGDDTCSSRKNHSSKALQVGKKLGLIPLWRFEIGWMARNRPADDTGANASVAAARAPGEAGGE